MVNDSVNNDDGPERITQAQLARELGVSPPAVTKAVQSGRIKPPGSDGKLNRVEAIADWKANTRPGANQTTDAPREKRKPGGQTKYSSARARKEHALAQLAEINLKKQQGQLVEAADVDRAALDLAAILTGKLEALPARVAGDLAHKTAAEIANTLDHFILELLAEFSAEFERAAVERARAN